MSDLSGKTLGQYEIEEPIGRGGMATVYKAYHPRMRRHVAIKVLPDVLAADPNFMARFEREAQTIAQLEHRSILPVHDYGEQGNTTYIVMRYINSGTLADRMEAGSLSHEDIARMTRQIAEGLHYAHRQDIIHRDLKPDNIFLDEEGNAILGDFGIAQIAEGTQELTGNAIIGTPAYMSPEQGQGQKLDGRSDIYALGVILFELFTGQVPFQSETPMGLVIKHITDTIPDPITRKPDLPLAISTVILKATAKRPEDRYQTILELADALESAVAGSTAIPPQWAAATAFPPPDDAEVDTAVSPPTPETATTAPLPAAPVVEPTTTAAPPAKGGIPKWAWGVAGLILIALIIAAALALGGDDNESESLTATEPALIAAATDEPTPNPPQPAATTPPDTPPANTDPEPTQEPQDTDQEPPPPTREPPPSDPPPPDPETADLPPVEPPDIPGVNIISTHTLGPGQEHVYEFATFFGGTAVAIVQPISENLDLVLELRDGETDALLEQVDEQITFPETLIFTPTQQIGSYYYVVYDFEGAAGTYSLGLAGTPEIGYLITHEDSIAGRLDREGTISFFYNGRANEPLILTVNPQPGFDVMVQLFDGALIADMIETGEIPPPLAEADDGLAGDPETLTFRLPKDGAYVINVQGPEGVAGTFTMRLNQ